MLGFTICARNAKCKVRTSLTSSRINVRHQRIQFPYGFNDYQGDSVDVLLEYSSKLVELFQYPWEMLPLMYVIVKDAGGNLEEAVKRIIDANNDIRALQFWKAVRIAQVGRTYCCAAYTPTTGAVGAPTYEGQVPYIGMPPPPSAVHLRPLPNSLSAHIPATRVPSSPDSPPEHTST